ncbi:MAG: endolytic transglycosylase MltG [bacterium]|nr:endolytic transglycosylase MltG [bacterium]
MKKLKNIAFIMLVVATVVIVGCCSLYNYMVSPVSKKDIQVEVEIPEKTSSIKIASILKEKNLIRSEKIFLLYLKIFNIHDLKAGYYDLSQNMGVKQLVASLRQGSTKNPYEIEITFQEGLNMRNIATIISEHTNNSYNSVIEKSNDIDYINQLIEKYWFITEEIKQDGIYYKLEGYLFPETYRFDNKDVSVEEIFNRMIAEMATVLEPHKKEIQKSSLSIHQILTLASMVEEEATTDRELVASVFMNRIKVGMSLGSDVTTRYAFQVDNPKQVLTKTQYNTPNPYNTRVIDGSMDGKLPIGPICTLSESSIEVSIHPAQTDYLYFIANIQTLETFFYNNASDFEKKKNELKSVNGGF